MNLSVVNLNIVGLNRMSLGGGLLAGAGGGVVLRARFGPSMSGRRS